MKKLLAATLLLFIHSTCFAVGYLDPTQPIYSKKANVRYQLQAILIDGKDRIAFINGKLYRKGDWVSGAKITGIGRYRATLIKKKQKIELHLLKGKN